MGCIPKGFQAMISPIIILTLAVSLKTTLNALGAADYEHDLMYAASEGLYNMLPAVIFLVACVLAFASGTSWGTFGILIPIVTAIFPSDSALLYIGISACCAGAVCGDQPAPESAVGGTGNGSGVRPADPNGPEERIARLRRQSAWLAAAFEPKL